MSEKKHHQTVYFKKIHLFFLAFSLLIVFASLYLPKTFNDYNELVRVSCGWPMPFITFTSHRALPDYAWTENCIGWLPGAPMDWGGDTNIKFFWLPFFLNIAMVFSLLTLAFNALQLIQHRSSGKYLR